MKEFKIDNKGTTQLFRNRFLERLTRTHFAFPVTLYYLIAFGLLASSLIHSERSLMDHAWIFFSGMIFFSLVEYCIHRFLFHFHATTEEQIKFRYHIHGVHHEFPRDKDRLVMPPVISLVIAAGFYFLFLSLLGDPGLVFFAGFCAGYSSYLIIHYAVHALRPPKNFLKFWWKHHALHHYAADEAAFSVSFPLWDYVFGTMPRGEGK